MPKSSRLKFVLSIGALSAVFGQAFGLDIVINAGAGLAGNAAALASFDRAAAKWEAIFVDPITVTINADMQNLGGGGVIGATGSVMLQDSYNNIRNQMVADASDEIGNEIVSFLPTAAQFSALVPSGRSLGGNIIATKANLKAMGFGGLDAGFGAKDADMVFNTQFAFHFGAGAPPGGLMDFETVVVHELGHALGFTSIVDNVAGGLNPINPMALDLFRFGTAQLPTNNAQFTTNARMLAHNNAASFSDTSNVWAFSTVGDGRQASHWKDNDLTGVQIGVMDPTLDFGVRMPITGADIRAFDLIGWDLPQQPVPEPATLAALGLGTAALLRRKRSKK